MTTTNPQPPRAVIYLRAAKARQDTQSAIDAQRQACERRAADLGLTVVDEYIDYGSAHTFEQRPGLQMMLSDLKTRRDVRYVIACDHARIARNTYIYTQIVWAIEEAGARLEVANLELDVQQSEPAQTTITDIAARQHRTDDQEEER
jgi:site-specific DNA recombinase